MLDTDMLTLPATDDAGYDFPATEPPPHTDPEPNRAASRGRKGKRSRPDEIGEPATSEQPAPPSGKRGPRGGRKSLQRDLQSLIASIGVGVSTVNAYDGAVILDNAEQTARRLDDLAKESPSIHRALSLLTGGTTGASVIFALAPIVIPIAHNHGMIPASPAIDAIVDGMTSEPVRNLRPKPDPAPNVTPEGTEYGVVTDDMPPAE